MVIRDAKHQRDGMSRRRGYDIWFRRGEAVLLSKRKMTEEEKERIFGDNKRSIVGAKKDV